MTLASRGGRNSTSTEYPVIGGSDHYKGACTGPLFYFAYVLHSLTVRVRFPVQGLRTTALFGLRNSAERQVQKSERPVGVPAALAWGMEGLTSAVQSFFEVAGCSAALASSRTTHRSKIVMIIPPLRKPNRTSDNVGECAVGGWKRH
jgi:hypothetical protein